MNTNLENQNVLESVVLVSKTLIGQADDLAKEHEYFNEHYMVGGRKALYDLLGKIYGLSEQLEASADKDELVKGMRFDLLKQHKIRTQANSSATAVLVRYITRADRKNVHVYARAIEVAKSKGISAQALPNFLQDHGGIEQIRSEAAVKDQLTSNEESLMIAKKVLWAAAEKPFGKFELNQNMNQIGAGINFDYFITVNTGGNQYNVVAKINANHELEEKLLLGFAAILDLQNSESKEKLLTMIEKGEKMRDQRRAANKEKIFSEQRLLRGEFAEVKQEQFDALFEVIK